MVTKSPCRVIAFAGVLAQLELMGGPATSHPSFWAPFVLVGDGGAP
jgi:CHAT domain-containing protein